MSVKRRFTGASSYGRYTPYKAPARKGYYGRRYKGFNQQLREVKFQTSKRMLPVDDYGWIGVPNTEKSGILVNGTDVGADVKQRIGRRITMKSLQLRMTISGTNNPINEYTSSVVRILVIYDRNPNGVTGTPSLNDIFDQSMITTTATGVTHYINCGKNMANKDRFLFLLDKTYPVEQVYGIVSGLPPTPADSNHLTTKVIQKNFYINLKNLNVSYNGIGSTLSNITEGALYVTACANKSSSGFSDQVFVEFASRVRFIDV